MSESIQNDVNKKLFRCKLLVVSLDFVCYSLIFSSVSGLADLWLPSSMFTTKLENVSFSSRVRYGGVETVWRGG